MYIPIKIFSVDDDTINVINLSHCTVDSVRFYDDPRA